MCTFNIEATFCSCRDKKCKQKVAALGETESTPAGHIVRVVTCFRSHLPLCSKTFINTDPDRLLRTYGMREDNPNSQQDCQNALYIPVEKQRTGAICDKCLTVCNYHDPHWKSEVDMPKKGTPPPRPPPPLNPYEGSMLNPYTGAPDPFRMTPWSD